MRIRRGLQMLPPSLGSTQPFAASTHSRQCSTRLENAFPCGSTPLSCLSLVGLAAAYVRTLQPTRPA